MSKFDFLVDIYFGLCILVVGMVELLFEDFWEFYDNNYILWVIVKVDEDGSFYMLVDCFQGICFWIVERDEELIFGGLD